MVGNVISKTFVSLTIEWCSSFAKPLFTHKEGQIMNNLSLFHFLARSVRLFISLISGVALVLVIWLLLSRQTLQVQAERLSPLANSSGWQQVNLSGFGDSTFRPNALSMAVFNNQLYSGGSHWDGAGASIWPQAMG
jgi:hypothetical protein